MGDASGHRLFVQLLLGFGMLLIPVFLAVFFRRKNKERVDEEAQDREKKAFTAAVQTRDKCLGCDIVRPLMWGEPRVTEARDENGVNPVWMTDFAGWFGYEPKRTSYVTVVTRDNPCLCDTCGPMARAFCEMLIATRSTETQKSVLEAAKAVADFNAYGLRDELKGATEIQRQKRQMVTKGSVREPAPAAVVPSVPPSLPASSTGQVPALTLAPASGS